jgi:Cu2+-exporting ATPase
MVQNLGWAVGYNAIALPLAAGAFAPFGVVLMSLSTIIVAINAQSLRGLRLREDGDAMARAQPRPA